MDLLSNSGLGSQLLGAFNNGLCYQFQPGQSITRDMVASIQIFPLIARKMAKMHLIKIEHKKKNILWERMKRYIDMIPDSFQDPDKDFVFKRNFLNKQQMLCEFYLLQTILENCSSPLVFCHNDLNIPNILFDGSDVAFIDVEYAGVSYAAYDVANHFVEFTGCDAGDLDYVKFYPKKDFQNKWIQEYLETFNGSCHQADFEEFYVLVQKFTLCSHLLWTAWALIQTEASSIDYDFLNVAMQRLNEYKRMKKIVLKYSQIA